MALDGIGRIVWFVLDHDNPRSRSTEEMLRLATSIGLQVLSPGPSVVCSDNHVVSVSWERWISSRLECSRPERSHGL